MNLNDGQKNAVYSNDKKILCLAGAGTGKTHTMIKRIERLVEDGCDPQSILVLTFTNAAAFEMKSRYNSKNKKYPEFRTFHGFCYNLIVRDSDVRKKIGYSKIPNILLPERESKFDLEIATKLSIDLKNPKSGEDVIFKKAKIKQMRKDNVISFDYLCEAVCNLFLKDDKVIDTYKKKFKYIFVDEFQDTDNLQWDFVSSFETADKFVVGDILQNIYSFRGTTDKIIKELVDNDDWSVFRLSENYRSTRQIIDYVNEFSKYSEDRYRISLESVSDGDYVDIYEKFYDLKRIVDKFVNMYDRDSNDTYAILSRTNREASFIRYELKSHGINVEEKMQYDLLEIVKSSTNDTCRLELLSTLLNGVDFSRYLRNVNLDGETYTLDRFLSDFRNNYVVNKYNSLINEYLDIVRNVLVNPSDDNIDILSNFLDLTITAIPFDCDSVEKLNQFIVEKLLNKPDTKSKNSIHIGTIHSSKGLEYDNVFVVGVNGKAFRLNSTENKNLFYVAITRAKKKLSVFFSS